MNTKRKFSLIALLILVLECMPLPAYAQTVACSRVEPEDTVAGLGSPVSITCAAETTVTIHISAPGGQQYELPVSTDRSGNATSLIPAKYTQTAGTYQADAGGAHGTFTVIADRFSDTHSMLSASSLQLDDDGADAITVTARLLDSFENPVRARPVMLVSSGRDDIQTQSKTTDDAGRISWIVRSNEAGRKTLSAYDVLTGKALTSRLTMTVGNGGFASYAYAADLTNGRGGPEAVDHFAIKLAKEGTVKANEYFSLTVSALDAQNQIVPDYVNMVTISSSDEQADFPRKGENPNSPETGSSSFREEDLGVRRFLLSFLLRTPGTQTITFTDRDNPAITGTITIQVGRDGSTSGESITILEPKDRSHIGGTTFDMQGKGPSLINVHVFEGTTKVASGETDGEGVFRIKNIMLPEGTTEAILSVNSENGAYKSAPILVFVDLTGAEIKSVSIKPEVVKDGDPAIIEVESEPQLKSVTADFDGQQVLLTETGSTGRYVASFTAPAAKIYNVKVTAVDQVDHVSQAFKEWTVERRTLPKVEGVTAEGQANQIVLRWKAVTGAIPVTEYKIYIAADSDPENFIYSLGTGKKVTSATIKDLDAGKAYRFYLTAIGDKGQESIEKSDPAIASILGMSMTVTPAIQSLMLEWTQLDLPLAHYILEFGTEPGVYTEKRTLPESARMYTLKDLLDVTYEVRLTPVAVTGKVLSDLAVVGRGTPSTQIGFRPSGSDPVPPSDPLHPGAQNDPPYTIEPDYTDLPATTGSGIPSMVALAVFVVAGLLGLLLRQHLQTQRITREFLAMMENRYHQ